MWFCVLLFRLHTHGVLVTNTGQRSVWPRGSAPPGQTKAKHHYGPIAVVAHFLCWDHVEPKQKMNGNCLELRDKGGFSNKHELKTPAGQVRTTIFLNLFQILLIQLVPARNLHQQMPRYKNRKKTRTFDPCELQRITHCSGFYKNS
jgi:hypothetical protein